MKQLNLKITEEFERDLRTMMRQRGITEPTEAIHRALREAVAKTAVSSHKSYRAWLGMGLKGSLNPKPRFRGCDLW